MDKSWRQYLSFRFDPRGWAAPVLGHPGVSPVGIRLRRPSLCRRSSGALAAKRGSATAFRSARIALLAMATTGVSLTWAGHPAPSLWAQEEEQAPLPRIFGLSVEPGGLLIQQVKLGELYDLDKEAGTPLKISNQDQKPRTYHLSAHRPSEVGNRKWLHGYLEIPDPSWFWFDKDTVTVAPESSAYVKMYLRIPQDDRYSNQHWVIAVGVRGQPSSGEALALAMYPRYQIETVSHTDPKSIPAGALALKPSILSFEKVPLGERQESKVTLHNNEAKTHQYHLSVITIPVDPTKERISPSPGYRWLLDTRWVSLNRRNFRIKAQQARSVILRVKVPRDPELHDQSWEALLWIEPDEGLPRFARIQVTTGGPENP